MLLSFYFFKRRFRLGVTYGYISGILISKPHSFFVKEGKRLRLMIKENGEEIFDDASSLRGLLAKGGWGFREGVIELSEDDLRTTIDTPMLYVNHGWLSRYEPAGYWSVSKFERSKVRFDRVQPVYCGYRRYYLPTGFDDLVYKLTDVVQSYHSKQECMRFMLENDVPSL